MLSVRVLSLSGLLASLLVPATWGATVLPDNPNQALAYQFSSLTGHAGNGINYDLGYTFTVTSPVTVTGLAAVDWTGSSFPTSGEYIGQSVAIYPSALTPVAGSPVALASATVLATDPIVSISGGTYTSGTGFRYRDLDAPVTLTAGTYQIVVANHGTGVYQGGTLAGTGVDGIAPLGPGLSNGLYKSPTHTPDYVYPAGGAGVYNATALNANVGPNFIVAVPEPAMMTTGVLMLGGLTMRRRKQA